MTTPLTEQGSAAIAALPGNFSNDVTLNNHKLLLVSPGTSATDGINKGQLDALGVPSGKNRIINGEGNIAQRGASVAVSTTAGTQVQSYGGPDRFVVVNGAGGTLTQSQGSITFNGVSRGAIVQTATAALTNATGGNQWAGIQQVIEGVNCYDLKGQQIAVSFLFQASLSGVYSVGIRDGGNTYTYLTTFTAVAGVPQRVSFVTPALPTNAVVPASFASGMTVTIGAINLGTFNGAASSSWQSATRLMATGALNWGATVGATIAAGEIQLEVGAVVTPFERRTYAQEYALCQRYYQVTEPIILGGYGNAGTGIWATFGRPVVMRANATSAITTTPTYNNASGITCIYSGPSIYKLTMTVSGTGNANADGTVLTFTAEL
jgi:hypothetical protein